MHKSNEQFSFSLPKSEKLKSKLEIDSLFACGKNVRSYPLKFLYHTHNEAKLPFPKFLVSVPKKKFKLAKDRNLLKRRIREAYRLNKSIIANKNIASIGIIYVSNQPETFKLIQDKLILGLNRLKDNITQNQL